ncbi:MAG TPA: DUF1858 domain-containing protein [Anaeromyxobacteraceae bacterium]|nr:DUF1858 domain-containing protein [Anaeromyxobacteraceae bacterium]
MTEHCGGEIDIRPDTRLGEILERWPDLEDVLVEMSPHFRALRNPVLRATVAKVATLRQVSTVSGVPLGTLVARLRAAAGLAPAGAGDRPDAAPAERPAWAATSEVTSRHDARAAIAAGEHPMPAVMAALAALPEGGVHELVTPFVPAPLVDLARAKGFASFSVVESEGLVRTYFRREPG